MTNKQTEINANEKMKIPRTWDRVESPNFFRFEKIGDNIEGLLLNKDTSSRFGFGMYSIKTFEGEHKRFHGSSQLDDLMMNIQPPMYIKIEYVDNQETANGQMKLFEVSIGKV